jgi:hypothetical protein
LRQALFYRITLQASEDQVCWRGDFSLHGSFLRSKSALLLRACSVRDSCGRVEEKTEQFSAYPGMSDRVSVYDYETDGSYTVTEGQVTKRYDAYGGYIGQGDIVTNSYEYDFYPDGSVHYSIESDARTGEYLSSAAYDEHGNLIAVQNQDGSGYTLLNEYSGDQLSKQERYSDEGSMISRVSFEYDDDGLLKRATFLTPGATTTVTVLYKNGPVYAPDAEE